MSAWGSKSADRGSRSCPSPNSLGDQRHQANSIPASSCLVSKVLGRREQLISKCLSARTFRGPVTQGPSAAWCGGPGPSWRSLHTSEHSSSPVRFLSPQQACPHLADRRLGSGRPHNRLPRHLQDIACWRRKEMRKQFCCLNPRSFLPHQWSQGCHPFSPVCEPVEIRTHKHTCVPFT